jgi:hypothetical protein
MSLDPALLMCGHYDDPGDDSPSDVLLSYVALCTVAALCVIIFVATQVIRPAGDSGDNDKKIWTMPYKLMMKYLACVHISILTYRCFFPVQYIGWFVWWQFPLSSLFFSRLISMVAEGSFATMIAMATQSIETERAKADGWPLYKQIVTWGLIVCAGIAQIFSWIGLVYQNNVYFLVADCLWLVGLIAALPAFIHTAQFSLNRDLLGEKRKWYCAAFFGILISVWAVAEIVLLLFWDLPKFWWRYQQQVEQDNLLLKSFGVGLAASWNYMDFQRWDVIFSHGYFTCTMIYYAAQMLVSVMMAQGPELSAGFMYDQQQSGSSWLS